MSGGTLVFFTGMAGGIGVGFALACFFLWWVTR